MSYSMQTESPVTMLVFNMENFNRNHKCKYKNINIFLVSDATEHERNIYVTIVNW